MSSLDEIKDIRAEAYERGHFVATQRAISRAELGLPLEYGVTADEQPGWSKDGKYKAYTLEYYEQAKTDG